MPSVLLVLWPTSFPIFAHCSPHSSAILTEGLQSKTTWSQYICNTRQFHQCTSFALNIAFILSQLGFLLFSKTKSVEVLFWSNTTILFSMLLSQNDWLSSRDRSFLLFFILLQLNKYKINCLLTSRCAHKCRKKKTHTHTISFSKSLYFWNINIFLLLMYFRS